MSFVHVYIAHNLGYEHKKLKVEKSEIKRMCKNINGHSKLRSQNARVN